ncbi:hypothetical protein LIER_26390 [Lithospermum erythrorhizon]|uniref:Protein kinase domain-containing protein n=1 Tax=Lithospermum erythrorhizon TaxID=34254 RepID=A0AAV3RC50_LITER
MAQYCLCFGRNKEKKPKKEQDEGQNIEFSRAPEMASAQKSDVAEAQLANQVVEDQGQDIESERAPEMASARESGIAKVQQENQVVAGDDYVIDETQLNSPVDGHLEARVFSYSELASATNNFSEEALIGEGGFGLVYKGVLESTGLIVALKKLKESGLQGEKEFEVEVLMLSRLRHPNLVILIGYCAEGDERILVYEYIPFGSLEYHLYDRTPDMEPLDWNTRVMIAIGAAKGLSYLHNETPPVIYRDMKSANILLDHNFQPKLSDFGLAKFGPTEENKLHVSTRVMGTYGYCAPEYASTGKLTLKSDIFSFGIVLFEIISGRRALDKTRPGREQLILDWASPYLRERNYVQLADPKLKGQFSLYKLHRVIELAITCVLEDRHRRPNANEVVVTLSKVVAQNDDPSSASLRTLKLDRDPTSLAEAKEEERTRRWRTVGGEGSVRKEMDKDRELERQKAVAEAKMWGEACREKKRGTSQGVVNMRT